MFDPWDHLGLPPGSPLPEIRRAYARLLKGIDQQTNPDAFRILRAAFEAASQGFKPVQQSAEIDAGRPPPAIAGPEITAPEITAPEIKLGQRILDAISDGRSAEAAHLLAQGLRTNELSIDEEEAVSAELLRVLQARERHNQPLLEEVCALLDWERISRNTDANPGIRRVVAGRDAGRWLAELRETAAMPWRTNRGWAARRRLARTMLRPMPLGRANRLLEWFLEGSHSLDYWFEGAARHQGAIDGRLDPGRLAWCLARPERMKARVKVRISILLAALPLFTVFFWLVTALHKALD